MIYLGNVAVGIYNESSLKGWLNKYGYAYVTSTLGWKIIILDGYREVANDYGTTIQIVKENSRYGN